jgi:excisionase family DNA binding protein
LLVSSHQAAGLLGIGRTTLYELIKLGAVTPVHIGRCVRFSVAELERYVEHLMTGTAESALPPASNRRTNARRQEPTTHASTATLF